MMSQFTIISYCIVIPTWIILNSRDCMGMPRGSHLSSLAHCSSSFSFTWLVFSM